MASSRTQRPQPKRTENRWGRPGGPGQGRPGFRAPYANARQRKPSLEWMAELLHQGKVDLTPHQLDQLWRFHALLRQNNHDRDLTRIIEFESVVVKHYVDCMCVGNFVELPSPLLDIGTGAGFPGIPLKIRYPDVQMVLAEQRPRRVEFLKKACAELGFQKIEVWGGRVVSKSFRRPMAGVITRAVETMDKTLLRTSGCSGVGTKIIFLKGPVVDPELQLVRERFRDQYRLLLDQPYRLLDTPHKRRLIVLERLVPATPVEGAYDEVEDDEGADEAAPE